MVHTTPVISILMPVYNAAVYLEACLHSILQQKNSSWELLAVDDFSTDSSWQLLKSFADQDTRIRVFRNDIKGIIPALAKAFEKSSGTYITRMDADDRMPENKLELLLQIASSHPEKVATGYVSYFSDKPVSEGYERYERWLNQVAAEGSFNTNIYRECVIASPNWMVHRNCFENHIPFHRLSYPEDYDLVFQWYRKGYRFEAIDQVTHFWREHADRTSRNSEVYRQASFFKLKTNYFVSLELTEGEKVQLVGSGVKAKLVAAVLKQRHVLFDQFDYGKKTSKSHVKSVDYLLPDHKTILTNWPSDQEVQQEILQFLRSKKLEPGTNVWLF